MRQQVGDGDLERVRFPLVPLASALERGGLLWDTSGSGKGLGGKKATTEAFRPSAWGETEPLKANEGKRRDRRETRTSTRHGCVWSGRVNGDRQKTRGQMGKASQ